MSTPEPDEIIIEPDDQQDGTAHHGDRADDTDRTEHFVREARGYNSLALRDIPLPDYCDVVIIPTRGVRETDPRVWAEAIFSRENATLASRGAKALRNEAIRLFDLVPPPERTRDVIEVVGDEALIVDDTPSLAVRIGVAVEPGGHLLRITTAVKYRNLRGRLTWAPRRVMHAAAVHTLARRAPVTMRTREVRASGQRGLLGVTRLPKLIDQPRPGQHSRGGQQDQRRPDSGR
ncbi:DUF2867 domain-containing protein [Helcobacillus massiliensis]|uniref:DUF2867 domain-containing protein n=1 Tax=Helcobacillus massiliensis TaxID=521392 RepID=UPI0021A82B1D|nr:DUF2867 domain-containing protein [Helcobacillus massiliensis]MCT1557306.1 DUF2867 domain-containing protein [Helcobacillus massiliensis]MCT2036215.1 DUF2867 domain-containing protein [Helcobacillus massiliensis]MCT2331591.1 DUF2867 domain-containing protein [Helcobacillus massiliensis]MDK7742121.1 DUF2867 domain-containing protein [Helcobacillus massiliensis]WOO93676.1 DUF2867 domain-containing protein [Helcobacillus massiliensis]